MPETWRSTRNRSVVWVLILLSAISLAAAEPLIDGHCTLVSKPDGRTPFAIHGWAVAECGEDQQSSLEVVLRIDGAEHLRGSPFTAWPGVAEKYPDIPGSDLAGFWAQVDPALLGVGDHDLEVALIACGIERTLLSETIPVVGPTSAVIAVPALVFFFAALGVVGWFLGSGSDRSYEIQRLPMIISVLAATTIAVVVAAPHFGVAVREISPGLFAPLANWDGAFYLELAAAGYGVETDAAIAFFPLYPAVLAVLDVLPGPLPLLASVLNAALFIIAVRMLRRLYPEKDSAILFFAALPFAFFHFVVYTEALALVLAVGYLQNLREERYGRTAVFGLLAGLTRITALPLVFFAIEPLRRRDWRGAAVAVAGPVAGLAAWMIVLDSITGDPLAFLHAQSDFGRSLSFHPGRIVDLLVGAPGRGSFIWWELASLAVVLVGAAALLTRKRAGEACYSAALVLMPLASLSVAAMNRYALAAFPAWILLGGLLAGRLPRRAFFAFIGVEVVLLLAYAARFGLQYWTG